MPYPLLADLVLALHVAIVLFVVAGLPLIAAGWRRNWRIARSMSWRLAHLGAIGFVALQAWLGADCPLTVLEMRLRAAAGEPIHANSFVGHWLQRLLYWDAPPWAFTLAYTLFGLAVAAAWWRWPPDRRG